nr:MAG TPA: hypothetical protein [Bacteriophage sp.]DAV54676.1 MAG TPA: hypothetical protein [Caudoviricetes sp.]DAW36420.1 MAG TPA: hypothetical protein [Caudoviricetes sp.]
MKIFREKACRYFSCITHCFFINHIRKRSDMKVPEKDVFEHFHVGPCI